ncbi:hypothetical protein SCP_0905880 [Sparassis crispa]|uniref:Uncharacterized protein n=1 Tax=Sparassis crispa TaxID=139825 RepID=A0A401GWV1_9APHY|nr:hypothetical protein SCP_0905880 [Sparassis crispa]GBE86708.1 hypothetical protein SCP_0905880 [Sparassis crispa]
MHPVTHNSFDAGPTPPPFKPPPPSSVPSRAHSVPNFPVRCCRCRIAIHGFISSLAVDLAYSEIQLTQKLPLLLRSPGSAVELGGGARIGRVLAWAGVPHVVHRVTLIAYHVE